MKNSAVSAPVPEKLSSVPVANVNNKGTGARPSPVPSPQPSPQPTEQPLPIPVVSQPKASIEVSPLISTSINSASTASFSSTAQKPTEQLESLNDSMPSSSAASPALAPVQPIEKHSGQDNPSKVTELRISATPETKTDTDKPVALVPEEVPILAETTPVVVDEATDVVAPPLPPSRKPSLIELTDEEGRTHPTSSIEDAVMVTDGSKRLDHTSSNEPSATPFRTASPPELQSVNDASVEVPAVSPPMIPPSRKSWLGSVSSVIESEAEPSAEPPPLFQTSSRRTIRFEEKPLVVEYNETKVELGISQPSSSSVADFVPESILAVRTPSLAHIGSPSDYEPYHHNEEFDAEEELEDSQDLDDSDEEQEANNIDNETYELIDEEKRVESKLDAIPPPPPIPVSEDKNTRPSLQREGSGGSRRSVRFGDGNEVKVEEYSYEDLDNMSEEPPSPTAPSEDEESGSRQRRSSFGNRVATIFKRGSSKSLKAENDGQAAAPSRKFLNGLSWG